MKEDLLAVTWISEFIALMMKQVSVGFLACYKLFVFNGSSLFFIQAFSRFLCKSCMIIKQLDEECLRNDGCFITHDMLSGDLMAIV